MLCRILPLLVIALNLKAPACSQDVTKGPFTLSQCIEMALGRHPLITAASERHQASVARIRQATAFPFPSIEYNSDLQPGLFDFVNSEESYLGASQLLELPRKRRVRGEIAEQESREIETDISLIRLEVAFEVKRSFYELLLVQDKLAYAERDLELAEEYLRIAELKLAAGDVGRVEVLRARVEALGARNAVKTAANDRSLARARLNYHLARGRNDPIEIEGQLKLPFVSLELESLQAEAFSMRPELKRFEFASSREDLIQESARLSNWPDVDVNISRHGLEGLPTTWSLTFSVPLPFLFQQRQKAEILEAQANIRALERESRQMRHTIGLEVEEAFTNAQKARDQIMLYQDEILPQAREVYDMFLFSYREGEIGGIELIDARKP